MPKKLIVIIFYLTIGFGLAEMFSTGTGDVSFDDMFSGPAMFAFEDLVTSKSHSSAEIGFCNFEIAVLKILESVNIDDTFNAISSVNSDLDNCSFLDSNLLPDPLDTSFPVLSSFDERTLFVTSGTGFC